MFFFHLLPSIFLTALYQHNVFGIELPFMTAGLLGVACLQLDHLTKLHSSCLSVSLSSVKYIILRPNEACSCKSG